MIERTASLRKWAKLIGIAPDTLKRWLAEELGLVLPRVSRGSKILIRESHVEMVYRKHVASNDVSWVRRKMRGVPAMTMKKIAGTVAALDN